MVLVRNDLKTLESWLLNKVRTVERSTVNFLVDKHPWYHATHLIFFLTVEILGDRNAESLVPLFCPQLFESKRLGGVAHGNEHGIFCFGTLAPSSVPAASSYGVFFRLKDILKPAKGRTHQDESFELKPVLKLRDVIDIKE